MSVVVVALLAFFASLIVWMGLWGPWFIVRSNRSIVEKIATGYIALLIVCAILSVRFWFALKIVVVLVTTTLVVSGIVSTFFLLPRLRQAIKEDFGHNPIPKYLKYVTGVALLYLFLDGLWAALPLYRYDQWTYHLVVSKWIDLLGYLKPPVTYDHIFFTGTFELLGLLPRFIWEDDAFQQGFQNSLSWCFVAIPAGLLAYHLLVKSEWRPLIALLFAGMLLFVTGDHEALVSAKPDYTLMMAASLVLLSLTTQKVDTKLSAFATGFLLVGMLAFKITWLHFAAAAGLFCLWQIWRDEKQRGLAWFVCGVTLALFVVAPFIVKNWLVFHNPLHPAQSSLWHSVIWNDELTAYWQKVTEKPHSLKEFLDTFLRLVTSIPVRLNWLLLVVIAYLGFEKFGDERSDRSNNEVRYTLAAAILTLYALFWGAFYGPEIFNRFVSPLFAFAVVSVIWLLQRTSRYQVLAIIFAVPVLLNGQIEVSAKRIIDALSRTLDEYHDFLHKTPTANNVVLRALTKHRSAHFPNAKYDQAILLSEYAFNFYGPSEFFIATDPVTLWHLTSRGIDPKGRCSARFLSDVDMRYVWVRDEKTLANWPEALKPVLFIAEVVEKFPDRGVLYYLPQWGC